jgi:hypothetical protein
MKRLTFAFLTLLAVLPSLMCFMTFCTMQTAQASEPIPCHEQAEQSDDGGAMLVSDCMGVDFFYQNTSNDFQPDQQLSALDFAWIDISAIHSFEPQNINVIRGPPFIEDTRNPPLPVYLTTQRLRI